MLRKSALLGIVILLSLAIALPVVAGGGRYALASCLST